jgi:putative flippase GtrA
MAFSPATARVRAGQALRRPHNWVQLGKFSAVGLSGYVLNLVVYTALLKGAGTTRPRRRARSSWP